MSITKIAEVFDHADVTSPREMLMLVALGFHDSEDRGCFPSVPTLATKLRLSDRQVRRVLHSLAKKGIITIEEHRGRGHSNAYTLNLTPSCQVSGELKPDTVVNKNLTPPSQNLTPQLLKPDIAMSGRTIEPQELHIEPQVKFKIPSWVPQHTWNDYEEMRKKIRKPMTDRARELAISKLAKLSNDGHSPGDVLEQSIMNSWQGLFEIRKNGANGYVNKGQLRQDASNDAIRTAFERITGKNSGNFEGSLSLPGHDNGNGRGLLEGNGLSRGGSGKTQIYGGGAKVLTGVQDVPVNSGDARESAERKTKAKDGI